MKKQLACIALGASVALTTAFAHAGDVQVKLSGDQETPAVTTAASGWGTINVGADKSVKGSITTKEVKATAAHIHLAAPGKSGPPVISLVSTADNVWSMPAGATLTDEQFAAFQSGNLYVNVHSAQNKPGEIRGQLKP